MSRHLPGIACLLLAALLTGCAVQRIHRDATERMSSGDFEGAMAALETGFKSHPDSVELRAALIQHRAEAVNRLISALNEARIQRNPEAAESVLNRALRIDPGNSRLRELSQALSIETRQAVVLSHAERLATDGRVAEALQATVQALHDDPRHQGLNTLRRDLERRLRRGQPEGARLLAETRPITLDFRDAGIRTVLELVTRSSGINFVFDKDVRTDTRVSIYVKSVPVDEALEMITGANRLSKRVLDQRTVLIYPNTPEKQREYQDQVVRVFRLAHAEAKGAASFLRAMLKVKEPFVDDRSNMLALREPPDIVQMAERLIELYDTTEPEVMLEVEVIEIGSNRLTDLGIKFPDTMTLTPLPLTGSGELTASGLRSLNGDRIGVAVAGLILNLKRQVGDFEILANPRVRAKNREKAKILIGNKVPVITTTTSQTGFVAENINYLDVGLKLELEPIVYTDDDVAIKMNLEVSSLASQIKTNTGLTAYLIQTRNASTTLRLRDGETQILGGLISKEQRSTANRLPGIGDIPVVGRLFSTQLDSNQQSELVLAITPRVVRNVPRLTSGEGSLWIGTDTQVRPIANPRIDPSSEDLPIEKGAAKRIDPSIKESSLSATGRDNTPGTQHALLRLEDSSAVRVGHEFTIVADLSPALHRDDAEVWIKFDDTVARLVEDNTAPPTRQGNRRRLRARDGERARAKATIGAGGPQREAAALQRLRFIALAPGTLEVSLAVDDAPHASAKGKDGVPASVASVLVRIEP